MDYATMEQQHETLVNSARGYFMLAMALKEAGYEAGFLASMKSEAKCFALALELEEKIEELNSCMAA